MGKLPAVCGVHACTSPRNRQRGSAAVFALQATAKARRDECARIGKKSVGSTAFYGAEATAASCPGMPTIGETDGTNSQRDLPSPPLIEVGPNKMHLNSLVLALATTLLGAASAASDLPVIFFHGVFGNAADGDNIVANLTADGRTAASLSFCDDSCSIEALVAQVPLAVAAVREVVANNSAFDDGYMIVAHSQGGAVARAVIEEMDDHQVKRFISMAGLQNGIFTGPNEAASSAAAGSAFLTLLVPEEVFNYTQYAAEDFYGKLQRDFTVFSLENPGTQYEYSQFNVARSPQFGSSACLFDQHRRKTNFLKLEAAHFFASPDDGVIMPWQSSHFGRYSEVATLEEIETNFADFTIVDMTETLEYTADTFGLRTLDERGGLHLHTASNVTHVC
ncbi:hypothetical protein BBJ28_00007923 [Nothophytophthora sp. Chile5]|nr:hypothetical protein BBJ28_00007923 [Nothophytophthora sp. Chile5]